MLAALLLLAAAAPQTAVEAERAFAADAQRDGQWTAFRRWAAEDAVLFTPTPKIAAIALKDVVDPPRSVAWSPTASFVSCDGLGAANTGDWRKPDGKLGFFSTIWVRGDEGWRWRLDGGGPLATPRARVAVPRVRTASCAGKAPPPRGSEMLQGNYVGGGASPDFTLRWTYGASRSGARHFIAQLWNGRGFDTVIDDIVPAPVPEGQ